MQTEMIEVLVCTNRRINKPACAMHDSAALLDQLKTELEHLSSHVRVKATVCMGFCNQGPNLRLAPGGPIFNNFDIEQLPVLLKALKKMLD